MDGEEDLISIMVNSSFPFLKIEILLKLLFSILSTAAITSNIFIQVTRRFLSRNEIAHSYQHLPWIFT